jgi:hypothetical protein
MREVVLDTNVLVAALRSRRGASYQLNAAGLTQDEVDRFLNYIFRSLNLMPSVYPMRRFLRTIGGTLLRLRSGTSMF